MCTLGVVLVSSLLGYTVASSATTPVRFADPTNVTVREAPASASVTSVEVQRALAAAAAAWSSAPCSRLELHLTPTAPQIEIQFVASGWPGALDGALGVTTRTVSG